MNKVFLAGAAFCIGLLLGARFCASRETLPGRLSVITRTDTVRIVSPPEIRVRYLKADTVVLQSASEHDSVRAVVPVEQVEYSGNDYRAYVSGYRPKLDSLVLLRPVAVNCKAGVPRFSLGLQAGYGITPRGFQPYIGVGISCTIGF